MIVIPTEAYPLQWPANQPRTRAGDRKESKFGTVVTNEHGRAGMRHRSIWECVERVRAELRRTGAITVVISSMLPLRNDGLPRSDASQVPQGDPGVAVYWTRRVRGRLQPHAMPCDRWNKVADNLYAIALSIEALRGMERWGAVSLEQAFAGFAALPPGDGTEIIPRQPVVDWRTILGGTWPEELEPAEILGIAKARHRKLIAIAHPDAGGSVAAAAELNDAINAAEQELRAE